MQTVVAKGITHGVYVITVNAGGKINGMTASWVSQVSFNPLMLMVSIAPGRYSNELIKESGYFAINVLSAKQDGEARLFGFSSGRDVDKFKNTAHFKAPNGSPVIESAMAYCECKLAHVFSAGDHELFVGDVVAAKLLKDVNPLLFAWDKFF
ncbi:MAG: flavin reductase [Nitrospirae bacterium]|nr:flavin reductase [Nitrospirota bacterium]MBF0533503.1 flavin reductase [Nitrospirota bacterium]MBF0615973.1 flavin reductase [Nitrospirota bacterium]